MRHAAPLLLVCAIVCAQQAAVEQAWDLAAKGQREQAIQLLRQVVTKDTANVDAHLLLGSLLSEAGNAPDAIEQLAEAVKLKPESADAQNALGEAYLAAGDYKNGRAPFEKAAAINARFAPAQLNLGSVLLQSGDFAAAAQHLDRAIQLLGTDSEAAYAHYLRAKVYSAAGNSQNAAKELEHAIAIRPNYPEAWSDLGQARRLLLDDAGALAAQKRAVELNSGDAVAQYRLGAEYLRQQQIEPAIQHLEAAYRLNDKDQSTLNALQSALRQAGKTEEAQSIKQKLAGLLREKDRANQNQLRAVKLNNEGAAQQKAGELGSALEKYREAVALYPSHVGIRLNYAVALLRLGQWTEGLNEMHEALERDPGNAQIRAALQDALHQAPAATVPQWAEKK